MVSASVMSIKVIISIIYEFVSVIVRFWQGCAEMALEAYYERSERWISDFEGGKCPLM